MSAVMASASSTALCFTINHLGFSQCRSSRSLRTTSVSVSQSQDPSILQPPEKPDGRNETLRDENLNSKSVTTDKTVIPKSQIIQRVSLPPLVSALEASAKENTASFHFPGHNRGQAAPPSLTQLIGAAPFLHDFSALPDLGNLFSPEGPILEAQKLAAKLFGSSETWFLVGGTTCGIQAAVMATCSPGDHIILSRNSHFSAISAMVLSGAVPKCIIPEYNYAWDIIGGVTPLQVETALKELELDGQKAAAVFVTSPTYHGICSKLGEISKLCHSRGIPLIVDEAHGAHFGFHPKLPYSAIQQGADLAVQSTHKVLSSLTQSSMLHLSGNIVDREKICRCLQTLQSTSPSFLLLASLDAARAQISENPEALFDKSVNDALQVKDLIRKIPHITVLELQSFPNFPAIDPLRLTIGFWHLGLSGYTADEILSKDQGVIPELVGTQSITCVINLGTGGDHLERLVTGINNLSAKVISSKILITEKRSEDINLVPFADMTMGMSPREAFFLNKKRVSIRESLGEICGELICPFPPGIPAMIPGEIITERALNYMLQVRNNRDVIIGASDPSLSSLIVCSM